MTKALDLMPKTCSQPIYQFIPPSLHLVKPKKDRKLWVSVMSHGAWNEKYINNKMALFCERNQRERGPLKA